MYFVCKDCEIHRYPVSVKLEPPQSEGGDNSELIVSKFADGSEERITVEQWFKKLNTNGRGGT